MKTPLPLRCAVLAALSTDDPAAVRDSATAGAAVADAAIEELTGASPMTIVETIRRRHGYHTPFVAARLLDWYDENYMEWSSARAVAVTQSAVEICRTLDPQVPALRCRAEKDAGNALGDAGRYEDAAGVLRRAERSALATEVPALYLAPVRLAVAQLRITLHRYSDALGPIEQAKALYAESSQPWRVESCRAIEATALYHTGGYGEAREVFVDLLRVARGERNEIMTGMHLANVALCDVMLGHLASARACLRTAITIFDLAGAAVLRARALRGLGRIAIREHGRLREMRSALAEFDLLGRADEWVLTELAIAEEMAKRQDNAAVIRACQHAYDRATQYGIGAAAANALAMLLDAARAEQATGDMIASVADTINLSAASVPLKCEQHIN